jgi:LacI family transcriptional regulator
MKKTTIKDVAVKAEVSVSTVSRVLNGKPDINIETKEKILKAIEELNYVPSSIARDMVMNKTHTIGLILPDITNPYFSSIARGIQHRADEFGYSIILCDTEGSIDKESNAVRLLKSKRVAGIIAALSIDSKRELSTLLKENFPIVQIDRNIPGLKVPTVTVNNFLSAKVAVNYLIECGHSKIAHIAGDLSTKTARDRLQGYQAAMKEYDFSIDPGWIMKCDFSTASGMKIMDEILGLGSVATAVFCANDLIAVGAYKAIKARGLKIPEDMSIIGHDDIELSSLITPSLTTMSLDKYEMGKKAVEAVIGQIETGRSINSEIILETNLVIRESVNRINCLRQN